MSISREKVEKLLTDHVDRLNLPDAPEPDTEQFRDAITTWKEAFDELGFQPGELARASRRTARNPSPWWREQLPAIIAAVEVERTTNIAQGPDGTPAGPAFDRDTAVAASRDCEWCEGTGIVFVFHRRYEGSPIVTVESRDGSKRHFVGRASKMCRCDYGRWMLNRIRNTDRHLADRLDGVDAVIEDRSEFVAYDPSSRSEKPIRYAPGRMASPLQPAVAAY